MQDINALKTAIANDDAQETRALAHKIKGTTGSFAAEAVAKCAYDIESNASSADNLNEQADQLSNLLEQTRMILEERLA